jgi:AraC-like DNA-binding protein
MAKHTDASILLKLASKAMANAGIPADQVFTQAGIALSEIANNRERTPYAAQNAFWQALERITDDPDIGLHLSEFMPVFRGQVLEYLFFSSRNFGDGLKRSLAYQRLLTDVTATRLVITPQHCYLADRTDSSLQRHFGECLVGGTLQFFKLVTDGQFKPQEVHFMHVEGAAPSEYERIYGCPVTLGCAEGRLYFNREVLNHVIWQSEPGLLRLHEKMANEKLAELQRNDLVTNVSRAIGAGLESGDISLQAVAQSLGIPERRLRSQLTEAETSFNQILMDYRSRLARRLLAKTRESIEQIVYLTGFSDPSTFYRAFKRWTGETPLEYRQRKQTEARQGA